MSVRIDFTDDAEADFENALEWHEHLGLRSQLGEAVAHGIALIAEAPHRWREVEPGIRRLVLRRVPYSIVYVWQHEGDRVVVIAISHHKREPSHWRERP